MIARLKEIQYLPRIILFLRIFILNNSVFFIYSKECYYISNRKFRFDQKINHNVYSECCYTILKKISMKTVAVFI